jgi:hypothetical protein
MSANTQVLRISGKCDDLCSLTLLRRIGEQHHKDGPFHGFTFSGVKIGSGDYINLDIDVATGKIVGWDEMTARAVEAFFREKSEEADAANITAALLHR